MPDPAGELRRALDDTVPADPREAADVDHIRHAVDAGDVWSRGTALHVTGSALVVHPSTRLVLLRWHPRLGRWAQVGGHADAGETDPFAIALREAREETGLGDLCGWPPESVPRPIQAVIVPVPGSATEPAHEHADLRYLLATERPGAGVLRARCAAAMAPRRGGARRGHRGESPRAPAARSSDAVAALRTLLDEVDDDRARQRHRRTVGDRDAAVEGQLQGRPLRAEPAEGLDVELAGRIDQRGGDARPKPSPAPRGALSA